jgi:hypothetical protein
MTYDQDCSCFIPDSVFICLTIRLCNAQAARLPAKMTVSPRAARTKDMAEMHKRREFFQHPVLREYRRRGNAVPVGQTNIFPF